MTDLPPHEYRRIAAQLGRSAVVTNRAIRRAAEISALGIIPVLTLGELASRAGASSQYLREIISRRSDPYTDITRRKKDGTTRPIASPEPVLMDVHRWVLENMLGAAPAHHCSWAYRSGRSIVGCAAEHIGARWLVKVDVHNFFGSIDEIRVYELFRGLRYPSLLSFELSRLCTRAEVGIPQAWRRDRGPYTQVPVGVLPQGAPTSGALANAAMLEVDDALAALAERHNLTYTRYSDDLVFSAVSRFSRGQAAGIVAKVDATLRRHRLQIHRRKTSVVTPGARKVVLGLLLEKDGVALPLRFKRRIQTHVRGVGTFGLVAHAEHRRFRSVLSMIEHVDGCIAFAKSVDASFAASVKAEWNDALSKQGFPVG